MYIHTSTYLPDRSSGSPPLPSHPIASQVLFDNMDLVQQSIVECMEEEGEEEGEGGGAGAGAGAGAGVLGEGEAARRIGAGALYSNAAYSIPQPQPQPQPQPWNRSGEQPATATAAGPGDSRGDAVAVAGCDSEGFTRANFLQKLLESSRHRSQLSGVSTFGGPVGGTSECASHSATGANSASHSATSVGAGVGHIRQR